MQYGAFWQMIAGGELVKNEAHKYSYRFQDGVLYIVTDHVTYHQKNERWVALGNALRLQLASMKPPSEASCGIDQPK